MKTGSPPAGGLPAFFLFFDAVAGSDCEFASGTHRKSGVINVRQMQRSWSRNISPPLRILPSYSSARRFARAFCHAPEQPEEQVSGAGCQGSRGEIRE